MLVFFSNKDGMETWYASLDTDYMKRCHSSDFHEIRKQVREDAFGGYCLFSRELLGYVSRAVRPSVS